MKKYLAKVLAAALSVAMLAGCGSSSSAAPAQEAPAQKLQQLISAISK